MKRTNFLTLSHEYQMDKTQVLGKGSTGEVYLGKQLASSQPVAIKLIRLQTIDNEVTDYLLRMQKIALQTIVHQNVLKGFKIIENASKCYMVTEYCNGGTLKHLIKKERVLNEEKSLSILKGILKGYNALVRKKVVHRDLKPANIMLHNDTPKIIDFGYCEIQGYQKPSLEYNVGSPSYMAPESFQSNIYNQKTQIWAIGIILFECLMGKTFDDGKHMSEVFKTIKKFGIPFGKEVSDKCRRVINWCLEFMPQKRPSALELLNFLTQRKVNQPEFFILQKNRVKTNSVFINQNSFESANLATKRRFPVVERKLSSALQTPTQKANQMQPLQRKISVKDHEMMLLQQEISKKTSRSNSRSKEQYGFITKKTVGTTKVQSFGSQFNRQKINSNYLVKNEYGLNREAVLKTEKYFTGQNVHNKLPLHHVSAFTSAMTSPRDHGRKQTEVNNFVTMEQRNPESTKQRVISKPSISFSPSVHQSYFERNPSMTYRPAMNQQQKTAKYPIRKQNMQYNYLQKQPTLTTRHSTQNYHQKPQIVNQQSPSFSIYESSPLSFTRERPSSSIYQLNNFLNEVQRPVSIFSSGRDFAQNTYR